MKIIFIFVCSGKFRNVPACSGMFHVPDFIDGLFTVLSSIQLRIGVINRMPVKTFHVRWILSSNLTRLPAQ